MLDACRSLIVPLPAFVQADINNDKMSQLVQEQKFINGPYRALVSMQEALRGLTYRTHSVLQSEHFDDLEAALKKCHIGFIKDDKSSQLCTSASLGNAEQVFEQYIDEQKDLSNDVVLVFNFGTGGGKVSAFSKPGGMIQLLFEIKPRENAPSPNACKLGNYTPQSLPVKELKKDLADMSALLAHTSQELAKLGPDVNVVRTSVFVTGPIRAWIFDKECKTTIDALWEYMAPIRAQPWTMSEYMAPIRLQPSTMLNSIFDEGCNYALPQSVEAEFENIACATLYTTLRKLNRIDKFVVVDNAACGIGNGSCQTLFASVPVGMKKLEQENWDSKWLLSAMVDNLLTSPETIASFVHNVEGICARGELPLLACKSGFVIPFDNKRVGTAVLAAIDHAQQMTQRLDKKKRMEEDRIVENTLRRACAQMYEAVTTCIQNTSDDLVSKCDVEGEGFVSFHLQDTDM